MIVEQYFRLVVPSIPFSLPQHSYFPLRLSRFLLLRLFRFRTTALFPSIVTSLLRLSQYLLLRLFRFTSTSFLLLLCLFLLLFRLSLFYVLIEPEEDIKLMVGGL